MIRKYLRKKFVFNDLSLEDTTLYKGLAILMIVMHNFFHWLPPGIGENEQNFNPKRFENYINILSQPEFILQGTFSFLGHYGVQMFLFLSAYGLTKKYWNSNIDYIGYIKRRIFKIYPAFLFSIIVWAIYMGLIHGGITSAIQSILDNLNSIIYKLVFIANFIPRELYRVNGPWWFVSLIVQFYLIFPYMLSLYKKYGVVFLIFISIGSLIATALLQPVVSFPLPGTVLTHIPELSIGIFLAHKSKLTINYYTIIGILTIFVLSNLYQFFWYFSFASILILMIILFQVILSKSNKIFRHFVLFIGSISMYIFYINGFMRQPWINSAKYFDSWYTNIIICLFSIVLVVAISYLMSKISDNIKNINMSHRFYILFVLLFSSYALAVSYNHITVTSSELLASKKIKSKIKAKGKVFNLSRGLNILTAAGKHKYKVEHFDTYGSKEETKRFLSKIETLVRDKAFFVIASHDAINNTYPRYKEKLSELGFKVLPTLNFRVAYIGYQDKDGILHEFSDSKSITKRF